MNKLLAARLLPETLDNFFGQSHLLGPGKTLRRLIESDHLGSAIFFGPPGCGKSALAYLISRLTRANFIKTNTAEIGLNEIRKILADSRNLFSLSGKRTIILLDEIHHFNRTQQDVLLPAVEDGVISLIGLTTENPYFYVNSARLSRSAIFEFFPLTDADLNNILQRALTDEKNGLGKYKINLSEDARKYLINQANGDARRLLNALEVASITTPADRTGKINLTRKSIEESSPKKIILYDKTSDAHYDHISAYIKSMRGSDPDAAIYWMTKMLMAGEDPRFIARRLVICAAEDIGLADPLAIVVASAALQAVEFVGMPEAKIPLAEATIYLATAPKSNSAYRALLRAEKEVEHGPRRDVPEHLRDSNLDAETRGHGQGYKYPHDFPGHFIQQEYLPKPVKFYERSEQGYEKKIKERLQEWDKIKRDQTPIAPDTK